MRQFEFFRTQTAPNLSSVFDAGFWSGLLLQLGHAEPTIFHSIVAVGSLHEQCMLKDISENDEPSLNRQIALDNYNKAIARLTASRSTDSAEVVFISCLLFVCLELLLENEKAAVIVAHGGIKLIESWKAGEIELRTMDPDVMEKSIVPIFRRLEIQVRDSQYK